jgi:pyruvate dehydrogenase E1 component
MIEDSDPTGDAGMAGRARWRGQHGGKERANYLMRAGRQARGRQRRAPAQAITTPFRNTISPAEQKPMPGDLFMERRIRSLIRWNALAMVMRANDNDDGLGGHISQLFVLATLYDVGFNYFFRGTDDGTPATWCSTRATARRASTPAPTWRAG